MIVYRVQDHEGRGPFKPGQSHLWADDTGAPQLPPIFEEFPNAINKMHAIIDKHGGAVGCACRSIEQVMRWFTQTERERLTARGYHLVSISADKILAESPNQVVFWRQLPLRFGLERLDWPVLTLKHRSVGMSQFAGQDSKR